MIVKLTCLRNKGNSLIFRSLTQNSRIFGYFMAPKVTSANQKLL